MGSPFQCSSVGFVDVCGCAIMQYDGSDKQYCEESRKGSGVPEEHLKRSDTMAYHYITTASSDSRLLQVRVCVVARDSMFFIIIFRLHAADGIPGTDDSLGPPLLELMYSIPKDFT